MTNKKPCYLQGRKDCHSIALNQSLPVVLSLGLLVSLNRSSDAVFIGFCCLTVSSDRRVAVLSDVAHDCVRHPRSSCNSNGCRKSNNECGERSFHWAKKTPSMSSCKKTLRHPRRGQTEGSPSLVVILNTPSDQMTHLRDDLPTLLQGRRTLMS